MAPGTAPARPPAPTGRAFTPLLLLYLATLGAEAVRKLAGLPSATSAVVYVLTGVVYVFLLPKVWRSTRNAAGALPVWLALLSLWCAAEAAVQRIPVTVAVLGWVSYVFFVPLCYVGAELMSDERRAALALRVVAVAGGVVGLGAIASALLGQHSPAALQPITPGVAIHSSTAGNVYLAPSIFATAEEASEHLLIALFAWVALAQLRPSRMRTAVSAVLGALIAAGLLATARRADIMVAVVGVVGLVLLGWGARRGQRRRAHPGAAPARGRLGPALVLAAGPALLLALLGTGTIVPFLRSGAHAAGALKLMFSPAHPAALTGQGPGTSTQGTAVVGAIPQSGLTLRGYYTSYLLDGRSFLTAEGGLTKTWLELGIVGVVLYAGVFAAALGPLVIRARRLDGVGRSLAALAIALGVVFLKGHQSLDNPLVQPLFWLAVGGAWGRLGAAGVRPRHQPAAPPVPPRHPQRTPGVAPPAILS